MSQLTLFPTSSLEKIFADEPFIPKYSYQKASMLINERFSYQIAYYWDGPVQENVTVTVEGPLHEHILIRAVGLVPSQLPVSYHTDDYVLRTTPGLYPDPLYPLPADFALLPRQWRSLFITIPETCPVSCGCFEITIAFSGPNGQEYGVCHFEIERIPAALPPQKLIHTEWFHCDCLATWYNTPVFSKLHWELIENYIRFAYNYGINTILTPLFTPPLDTAIGTQRPTVQLVDVIKEGDAYRFDYKKLSKWIRMCDKIGIKYFEFSHLFTQWGAGHAPKIIIREHGKEQLYFGWDTDASSPAYRDFLRQFLSSLVDFLNKKQITNRCFFHVSDEPGEEHLPAYTYAINLIREYTNDMPVIDALSSYHLFKESNLPVAVCATDAIEPFLEHHTPNLWAYYCCGQENKVSNRFFAMPSSRNRSIGLALYKYQIRGFLHWGYNFWYSELSRYPINPFVTTDASCRFPSGDPFVVYPGEKEPISSLRLEVFFQALQDIRRMELLESYTSHEYVVSLLEHDLNAPITFKCYPHDTWWFLNKQEEIHRQLIKYL